MLLLFLHSNRWKKLLCSFLTWRYFLHLLNLKLFLFSPPALLTERQPPPHPAAGLGEEGGVGGWREGGPEGPGVWQGEEGAGGDEDAGLDGGTGQQEQREVAGPGEGVGEWKFALKSWFIEDFPDKSNVKLV